MAAFVLDQIADQVRADLRNALRLWNELRRPINAFMLDPSRPIGQPRFYVLFDMKPRKKIQGLSVGIKTLALYDEPIINKSIEFAGKVWHLKDKLAKYAKAKGVAIDIDGYVNQRQPLTIAADLANANKHFGIRNRSGLSPHIELVLFDTSQSGVIEFFYDGATKEKELLVSLQRPIPYTVELRITGGAVMGDAVHVIRDALEAWAPLIKQVDVLAGTNPEAVHLRQTLNI